MTERTAAVLADPHPNTHIIYPYTDSEQVVEAVGFFVAEGLYRGESAVLIITEEKRAAIASRLNGLGFDTGELAKVGRLCFLDPESVMSAVSIDEVPLPVAVERSLGSALREAREHAPKKRVRVYGEMVNMLCAAGREQAAAEFEEIWNKSTEAANVPVLCSYSVEVLASLDPPARERLLKAHTHELDPTDIG